MGVDHQLVIGAEEEIFETSNGCICCTVRGDLIRVLGQLLKRRERFDSHPHRDHRHGRSRSRWRRPSSSTTTSRTQFVVDAIVTLVDARHFEKHLHDAEGARDPGGLRGCRDPQQDRSRVGHRISRASSRRSAASTARRRCIRARECAGAGRRGAGPRRLRSRSCARRSTTPSSSRSTRSSGRAPTSCRAASTSCARRASMATGTTIMSMVTTRGHERRTARPSRSSHAALKIALLPVAAATPQALAAQIEPAVRVFAEPRRTSKAAARWRPAMRSSRSR